MDAWLPFQIQVGGMGKETVEGQPPPDGLGMAKMVWLSSFRIPKAEGTPFLEERGVAHDPAECGQYRGSTGPQHLPHPSWVYGVLV